METGYRRNNVGNPIPRDIISRFVCMHNGTEVFRADFFPAALRPVTAGYPIQFGLVLSKLGGGELELRRLQYSQPHRRGNRRPVRHH